VTTIADLRARLPVLDGAFVVGVDLRDTGIDWTGVAVDGTAFVGCRLPDDDERRVRARGAICFPPLDHLGFEPYRGFLYSNDELMAGYEPGRPETTYDARVAAVARVPPTPLGALARGVHDACIDAALTRFLETASGPVVGVMGSHATGRDQPEYLEAARLGRDLTRAGFVVATGGGPGLMEAANLGAWLAAAPDSALDEAIAHLASSPDYAADPVGFLHCAREVRARWPESTTSLGVPTWIYVDEPPNQFATHVAKYFENSIRENGLLAIAIGGIVFTPGGSGTAQEVFTDAAQNDYTMYDVRSPMLFLGRDHFDGSPLVAALRELATAGGWDELVRVVDTPAEAVATLHELSPQAPSAARPMRSFGD
jgi:predicted Rossmann-fold nucleotide-binding protein